MKYFEHKMKREKKLIIFAYGNYKTILHEEIISNILTDL